MGDNICYTTYAFAGADRCSSKFNYLYFGFHTVAPIMNIDFIFRRSERRNMKSDVWTLVSLKFRGRRRKRPTFRLHYEPSKRHLQQFRRGRRKRPHTTPHHPRPYTVAGSLALIVAALRAWSRSSIKSSTVSRP